MWEMNPGTQLVGRGDDGTEQVRLGALQRVQRDDGTVQMPGAHEYLEDRIARQHDEARQGEGCRLCYVGQAVPSS